MVEVDIMGDEEEVKRFLERMRRVAEVTLVAPPPPPGLRWTFLDTLIRDEDTADATPDSAPEESTEE